MLHFLCIYPSSILFFNIQNNLILFYITFISLLLQNLDLQLHILVVQNFKRDRQKICTWSLKVRYKWINRKKFFLKKKVSPTTHFTVISHVCLVHENEGNNFTFGFTKHSLCMCTKSCDHYKPFWYKSTLDLYFVLMVHNWSIVKDVDENLGHYFLSMNLFLVLNRHVPTNSEVMQIWTCIFHIQNFNKPTWEREPPQWLSLEACFTALRPKERPNFEAMEPLGA